MLLPRVQLISPTQLNPVTSNNDEEHTGLIVYVPNLWSDNYCPGVYIWDGKSWQSLHRNKPLEQLKFTDGEGNIYSYAKFGNTYWTTSNVMTTKVGGEPDGNLLSTVDPKGFYKLSIGTTDNVINSVPFNFETRQQIIDKGEVEYIMNNDVIKLSMLEYASKFGVLYTYQQALQACPTGWKLPNKADFDEMYKFIQENFHISAIQAATSMRNDESVYTTADGSKHSWAGVNLCSSDAINSGYNALPAGATHGSNSSSNTESERSSDFGSFAFWWFDSEGATPLKRYSLGLQSSILTLDSSVGGVINPDERMGYSVRCIKK